MKAISRHLFFKKKYFGERESFLPLIPLFWTSGDVSSGFQSQSRFCLIHTWQRHTSNITHSLRFTSGATPADLLAASMATEPISSTYLQRHWWESNGRPLTPWANAQPTELCRLGNFKASSIPTDSWSFNLLGVPLRFIQGFDALVTRDN